MFNNGTHFTNLILSMLPLRLVVVVSVIAAVIRGQARCWRLWVAYNAHRSMMIFQTVTQVVLQCFM